MNNESICDELESITCINEFISAIGINTARSYTMKNTLVFCRERGVKSLGANRSIINRMSDDLFFDRLGNGIIFDYFYESVIYKWVSDTKFDDWTTLLISLIKRLLYNKHHNELTDNSKYVRMCQFTSANHTKLFEYLVKSGFSLGSPVDLIYQLIARGETDKLELLSIRPDITEYFDLSYIPGAFAVALYNGIPNMLEWLVIYAGVDISDGGDIVHLEYLPRTCKSVDYVINRKVDYSSAFKYVLGKITATITHHTAKQWNTLLPDNFSEIYLALKPHLDEPIPLEIDFGSNNYIVHGHEWASRTQLVHKYKELQYNYECLQAAFDAQQEHLVDIYNSC